MARTKRSLQKRIDRLVCELRWLHEAVEELGKVDQHAAKMDWWLGLVTDKRSLSWPFERFYEPRSLGGLLEEQRAYGRFHARSLLCMNPGTCSQENPCAARLTVQQIDKIYRKKRGKAPGGSPERRP